MAEEPRTVADLLAVRAGDDRPGLRFESAAWTWRAVVAECARRAAWLAGRAPHDPPHIAVALDNIPEMVFLIGGAALSGQVVVALNTTRGPDDLARDVAATDCALLLYEPAHAEAAVRAAAACGIEAVDVTGGAYRAEVAAADPDPVPAEVAPEAPVMLIFTSGTSGRPRAVRVTHRKLVVPGVSLAPMTGAAVYAPMPLFHSGALMAAVAPALAGGATLVLRRRFSASALLDDVRSYGCTYLHYVGKALSYVLATPERPGDADNPLRVAFGNEGSAVLQERFARRFGCQVIDAFGSTETAVSISPDPAAPPGALGRLPPEVQVCDPATGKACPPARFDASGRLLNAEEAIGELVNVTGAGLFDGYYNDPDADALRLRDGRFHSGDYAYADADGFCYFAGRELDRLRVDGENLSAVPIEDALRRFPGVVEAAVYAVPDVAAGDQIMAALVLSGGFAPADFAAHVRDLAPKSVPRYVRICDALPQTASHKILKRRLAATGWHTGDPLWHRPGRALAYEHLTPESAAHLDAELSANGRGHLVGRNE
jgi:fatty-acyl-CoA synthase